MIELRLYRDKELENLWEMNRFNKGKGATPVAPTPTVAEKKADAAQVKELDNLQKQQDAREGAMNRKRQGRASLISGSEQGIKPSRKGKGKTNPLTGLLSPSIGTGLKTKLGE